MLMQDEGKKQADTTPNGQFMPGQTIAPDGGLAATTSTPEAPTLENPVTTQSTFDEPSAGPTNEGAVSWSASEFIAHQKSSRWYLALALGAGVLAAAVFLLFHDWITSGMIIIVAIVFGVLANRKPRTMQYQIDNSGIRVGQKMFTFSDFKYFTIIDEGAISSITLAPLRRFMLPLTIYYDPKDEERITDVLNDYVPYEPNHNDVVDNLMRRIRF